MFRYRNCQKALKTTKISEMPLRLAISVDLKNDVKVNPVSAHEKAKLLSQSQMKKTSTAPTSMNRGTEKQVNLKETFEEAAAREWRENHPEHENYQQRMPHQSPIVVASASNAAASKGITNMDIDDEAASKETNSGSLNDRARRVRRRANTSRKSIRARMRNRREFRRRRKCG